MAAGKYNIVIEQGATFSLPLTWKTSSGVLFNLTGYTARMQVRQHNEATSPLLTLTTENGGIVLGGAAGTIIVTIAATVTAGLPSGEARYDLELVNGAIVTRLIEGRATISREITR
jgi:hypothetical protein